ncbi:hypothetical protein GMORB2_2149 [Geosmithia morbida]|uniref:Uncharacterized protein n=1 Tax=Geosmithia morbida TaxID=1094350 RepID=A0A9P5D035_9HYPO|nr:uncharacterized protein GMORB2_2149 [Geosmithia morbida]KAF4121187.1 hypothetical protein GMORB2_2149 [Geosmithia morbida]
MLSQCTLTLLVHVIKAANLGVTLSQVRLIDYIDFIMLVTSGPSLDLVLAIKRPPPPGLSTACSITW